MQFRPPKENTHTTLVFVQACSAVTVHSLSKSSCPGLGIVTKVQLAWSSSTFLMLAMEDEHQFLPSMIRLILHISPLCMMHLDQEATWEHLLPNFGLKGSMCFSNKLFPFSEKTSMNSNLAVQCGPHMAANLRQNKSFLHGSFIASGKQASTNS